MAADENLPQRNAQEDSRECAGRVLCKGHSALGTVCDSFVLDLR